jgi:hypothetical protein
MTTSTTLPRTGLAFGSTSYNGKSTGDDMIFTTSRPLMDG